MTNPAKSADCECLIECDGEASLGSGERCRAERLRQLRELNAVKDAPAESAETWQPHGAFMIRIGDEHFAAIDRTGNRWREYPRDYTTTLRDAIIADRAKAAALVFTENEMRRYAGLLGEEVSKHKQTQAALDAMTAERDKAWRDLSSCAAEYEMYGSPEVWQNRYLTSQAALDDALKALRAVHADRYKHHHMADASCVVCDAITQAEKAESHDA